jgi:2'-5' RNA ligase
MRGAPRSGGSPPTHAERRRRLFFALLPSAAARAALQTLAHQQAAAPARAVRAADLHLTLLFLGSVSEAALPRLRAAAAAVRATPVSVVLRRLERWRGGLLCATGEATPALLALHRRLLEAGRNLGLPVDARALRAHITLARGLTRAAGACDAPVAPIRWRACSFCLMESLGRPDGGRYTVVGRWPLDRALDTAAQHDPAPLEA